MPNSPENYSFITYVWVIALSILGGTVRTLSHITMEMSWKCVLRKWFIDVTVSAFVGIVTFYLCEYAKLDQVLTAAFVGISAHMGTRVIVILEEYAYRKVTRSKSDEQG